MVNGDDIIQTSNSSQTATVAQEINGVEKNTQKNLEEECEAMASNSSRAAEFAGADSDNDDAVSSAGSDSWQVRNHLLLIRANSMLSRGITPLEVLINLFPRFRLNFDPADEERILEVLSDLLDRPPTRERLTQYSTLNDAVELFRSKKKILILTGAGVSVSCGIPDFRSENGIYARLHDDFPDLPDPTAMFDIRYFRNNPAPFYDFAKEIFPGQFTPSVSHQFIKCLEDSGQLLRNYTQNIDTLEHQTGITRVIECHGSFSKATCLKCHEKFDGNIIRDDVMNKKVPICKVCNSGVIKPDIVFFGEDLGQKFHRQITEDKNDVDLVVVIGSSLKVRPVSMIPLSVDKNVPQILINRESLQSYNADIELLGNCDDIIREICFALGGNFADMIHAYDQQVKQPVQQATSRRRFLDVEQFHNFMGQEADDDNMESQAKRPRLSESEEVESLANIRKRRFVVIDRKLPEMTCSQISVNQTVFPGAEMAYDMETKTVCRGKHRHANAPLSPDIDDTSSESIDSKCVLERSTSVDDLVLEQERVRGGEYYECYMEENGDSCPPHLEFEESEKITSVGFREAFGSNGDSDFSGSQ